MSEETAIVVGRFQPFHKGHESLLSDVQKDYEEVLVGIGTPKDINGDYLEGDPHNPLSYEVREEIIKRGFDGVDPYDVRDENHPPTWIDKIEKLMDIDPKERESITAITGNYRTADCFRWAGYQVEQLSEEDFHEPESCNGSVIRSQAANGNPEWKKYVPDYTLEVLDENGMDLGDRISQDDEDD